jgi:hypothetical protein
MYIMSITIKLQKSFSTKTEWFQNDLKLFGFRILDVSSSRSFPYFENPSPFRRHPTSVVNRSGIVAPSQTASVQLLQGLDDLRDSGPRPIRRVISDDQDAVGIAVVRIVDLVKQDLDEKSEFITVDTIPQFLSGFLCLLSISLNLHHLNWYHIL